MHVSRVIHAPCPAVYQAFLDPQAMAAWLAPDNMRAQVHLFEPHVGGRFRLTLTFLDPADAISGKTGGGNDTYHGRFVELIPPRKIVQAIEFETADPTFTGEMTMTVLLAETAAGTEVTLHYANLPAGIRPEDNEPAPSNRSASWRRSSSKPCPQPSGPLIVWAN